jgi:hypothetical protein
LTLSLEILSLARYRQKKDVEVRIHSELGAFDGTGSYFSPSFRRRI